LITPLASELGIKFCRVITVETAHLETQEEQQTLNKVLQFNFNDKIFA
jgi:hypothetical protein